MTYRFTIQTNGGSATTSDTYYPFAMTSHLSALAETTEANAQIQWYGNGTIKRLRVHVSANSATGNTVFRVRINGANGNSVITVGAGATGFFEDTTNTDTWADGDLICLFADRNAESTTIQGFGADAIASSGTVNKVGAYGTVSFSTASVSRYFPLVGDIADINTTELDRLSPTIDVACTARNLAVYISSNARTTNTTYKIRINGADGNSTVTVGSGVTGWVEDTSNTDTISAGDDVNWVMTTSTGTGAIVTKSISCDFTESLGKQQLFAQSSATNLVAAVTRYISLTGQLGLTGGTTSNRVYMTAGGTARNLRLFVVSNAATSATTLNLYKNGSATSVTISLGAGVTGEVADTTNTNTFADGDYYLVEAIRGAGVGTIVFAYATLELDHDAEAGGTRRLFLIT